MHKNDIDLHTSLRDFVNFAATLQPSNAGTFHADEQTLLETMCATLSKHPSAFDGNSTSHPSLAIVETYLPQLLGTMSDPTTRSTVESLTRHLNWYQIYDKATIDQSLAEGMFAAHVLGTRGLIKARHCSWGCFFWDQVCITRFIIIPLKSFITFSLAKLPFNRVCAMSLKR